MRRSWLHKQQKAEEEKRWTERQSQPRHTAFRKLAPFEERDDLPGHDRKYQARSIATRIASTYLHKFEYLPSRLLARKLTFVHSKGAASSL